YVKTSGNLKNAIKGVLDQTKLSTEQQLKLNIASATAERGLATLRGEASRLGLAHVTGIALQKQFGDALRGMGHAGGAAAGAFGLFSGAMTDVQAPATAAEFGLQNIMRSLLRMPQLLGRAAAAGTALAVGALVKLAVSAADAAEKILLATVRTSLSIEAY